MANEAVIIELGFNGGYPVYRTVADGTSISKGTLCKLADPNTASAATGNREVFAGIAASDKVANDGSTSLAFYTQGVYDLKSVTSPTVTVGELVAMSGANLITGANNILQISGGTIVGKAEETGSADEVIRVRLIGY